MGSMAGLISERGEFCATIWEEAGIFLSLGGRGKLFLTGFLVLLYVIPKLNIPSVIHCLNFSVVQYS